MNNSVIQSMGIALIGIALLSSCSRPVAYFQRVSIDPSATAITHPVATAITMPTQAVLAPAELFAQAKATITQLEAYSRKDSRLVTNKHLNERIVRVKQLLASTSGSLEPKASYTPHKMKGLTRLMLKKTNRKIAQQLAPTHPEKALVNQGQLIGSLVLLITGLLLLILGSGIVAFIGLIVGLVGAVGTILSLFGIDS